jgi:hypothetical protein
LPTTVPPALRRELRWPRTWPEAAVGVGACGVLGYGVAPFLGKPGLSIVLSLGGVLGAGVTAAAGARSSRQADLVDGVLEALAPRLGQRCKVRARMWRGGLVGVPGRLRIDYSPAAVDDDPTWTQDLLETVERRLGSTYRVHRASSRRRRLWLRLDAEAAIAAAEPIPPVFARAERIVNDVLGGTCTVTATWSGPDKDSLTALEVDYAPSMRVTSPAGRARVERHVSLLVPGRWRARWDLENDHVRFELRPAMPTKVPHEGAPITPETLYRIPLAVDEDGRLVTWDMNVSPHLMVVGRTGSGKTVTINGVVTEIARRGWPVQIVDPKRIEFLGMRSWPNVQIVATTILDQVAVILNAWRLMEDRYAAIEAGLADERDFEPLVIVLDEVKDLYSALAEWWIEVKRPGLPTRCPIFEKIASIARKGRSAHVHIILGTQRPDADFLTGEMRDNFAARVSQGPLSPQGAIMMWESALVGVGLPRKVAGRATAVGVDDQPVEVQTLWTPDPRRARRDEALEDLQILEALMPSAVSHARLQVEMNEDLLNQLDERGRSRQWEAVCGAVLVPVLDLDAPAGGVPGEGAPSRSSAPHGLPTQPAGGESVGGRSGELTATTGGPSGGAPPQSGPTGSGSVVLRDGRGDELDVSLLTLAAEVVLTVQFASAAMLQRKLRVGFAQALRLLTQLEDLGIVGSHDADRPDRPVLLPPEVLDDVVTHLRALREAQDEADEAVEDSDGSGPAPLDARSSASGRGHAVDVLADEEAGRGPGGGPGGERGGEFGPESEDEAAWEAALAAAVEDDFEGYGDSDVIYAHDIRPGDLVFLSDSWVIVEAAGPDVIDDSYICLDVRSDYDERDSVAVAESELCEVRRPVEKEDPRP